MEKETFKGLVEFMLKWVSAILKAQERPKPHRAGCYVSAHLKDSGIQNLCSW